jgi:hypoxanthine phosphoribosyltransferase
MNKTPNQLLKDSDLIHPQALVDKAISHIAGEISSALQDSSPLVLTVMNGGLYFAGSSSPSLVFH